MKKIADDAYDCENARLSFVLWEQRLNTSNCLLVSKITPIFAEVGAAGLVCSIRIATDFHLEGIKLDCVFQKERTQHQAF